MTSTQDLVSQSNVDLSPKKDSLPGGAIRRKWNYLKEVITVEPLVTSYLVAAVICLPALLTLELEKSCRSNLGLNETVCKAIRDSEHDNYTDVNDEITILLNGVHSWQAPCQNFAPLILVLFIGSYSDRRQIRKPFMILPLVGELFAVVGCILSVIFMEEWPVEVQGFLQAVVPSLFGGPTMLIMAVFSYVADSSTVEMRTVRIAIVQMILNVAIPIGQFLSGFLFIRLDYIGVLLVAAGLYLFGIAYGIFFIKEAKLPKIQKDKSLLADMFDPTNALDTFKVLWKKDAHKDLPLLWGILVLFFIVTGVSNVNLTTLFLYLRNTFHWTGPDFSLFSATNTVIHLIGIVLFVPLFTKVFNLSDVTILIFTFLDKIATTIITGLARSNIVLYIGCFVSIITNITIVALRSMATKAVSEEDLGKAQSLFGICEALGIAAMTPLINTVFTATLNDFPSAFIFIETIVYTVCFLMAFSFYCRGNEPNEEKQPQERAEYKMKNDEFQTTHI
ncbi:proton-coupled folate transporter-like [Coccinella septempunctata]|uniref:proton-coupled folate transporter-like n=1 Tax=Coccinella septempunctata TaxID=41139 RepID=UPI001D093B22|nr:proton-coupled folate transporter-like [Coccinella septempunctata]